MCVSVSVALGVLMSGRRCVIVLQLLATYDRDLSAHTRALHAYTYEYTRETETETE